jgi:hypothetical protein
MSARSSSPEFAAAKWQAVRSTAKKLFACIGDFAEENKS